MARILERIGMGFGKIGSMILDLQLEFDKTNGHGHTGVADDGPTLANAALNVTWTDWTPTVTQTGSVTVTISKARYRAIGKSLRLEVYLLVTGTGTAASDVVIGSLPVAGAHAATYKTIGAGIIIDNSASAFWFVPVVMPSTTTIKFLTNYTSYLGTNPNFGLAVNDVIAFECEYESV